MSHERNHAAWKPTYSIACANPGSCCSSRAIVGPESQMAFDVYGTKGALRWNLETMNKMEVFLVDDQGRAPAAAAR